MPTPRVHATTWRTVALAVLILQTATAARGQPSAPDPANLRGESGQTRKRLAEAEKKLADGHVAEAVEAVQRVLDDAGDDLVAIDAKQYRPARWIAHQILARLPADTLKGYQDRVEAPARKLLDAGKKNRDPAPLWQLLDRYFVSRPAGDGLLFLGDLLFEKGEFRAAERLWRRLLPDAGADIVYPSSQADPAAVRSRLVLAAAFAGDIDRATTELAKLKEKHPGAMGTIAGKNGPFAATLQAYLDAPPRLTPPANLGTDWTAFGGGPGRTARVGGPMPIEWDKLPEWKSRFPPEKTAPIARHHAAAANPPQRPPVGHPVVANGLVFVTDGYGVFGYDLLTGKLAASAPELATPISATGKTPPPDACPSLTAAGGRLYVRIGPALIRSPDVAKGKADDTAIVCLAPRSGAANRLEVLWRLKPPTGEDGSAAVWEGAPLVDGRRMWAAYARFEGGRVVQCVACYDPADPSAAPERPAWSAEVSDSPQPAVGEGRARQELLTLAGRNVVFNTNAGAVVALDAVTGRRAWGFRYPRTAKNESDRSPHPSPAVACDGRVFVAPTDSERVYALDAETGQLLWESGPTEGAQILGVAAGRVVVEVAGPRPAHSLRGLNVANGSYHREDGGWIQDQPGLPIGYGRGFVTDDVIFWPTRQGLFFIRANDGRPVPTLSTLHTGQLGSGGGCFGNVVFADGVLAVVTPTQVWGYVSRAKRFEWFRGQSKRDPVRADFETRVAKAEAALRDGDIATARSLLLAVAAGDLPRPLRAWAAARLLILAPKADGEANVPPDLLKVLTPEIRSEWVLLSDGNPVTVGTLLDRLVGRGLPAPTSTLASVPEPARGPGGVPALSADAEIVRSLRFDSVATPLRWFPGASTSLSRVFVTTADELVAVPLDGAPPVRYPVANHFTHAAECPDGFVVAGPLAVAVYASGRTPEWVFRVPTTAPLPATPGEFRMYSDDLPATAELSAFKLAGSWLVARLGERHLIALDLKGRRVAWVLGTDGRPGFQPAGFPGAPQFGAEFLVTGRLILAQISTGRRWLIALDTGKPLPGVRANRPTAEVSWPLPPAVLDTDRVAVSDGAGLVRLIDPATGAVNWIHEAEREASLTGEPPQVRVSASAVLVAVRRNHGVELDRLDATDGLSLWQSGPAFLDTDRVNLAHADSDADRVYLPAGSVLTAIAQKTGEPDWEAELPDTRGASGWVVRAGRECVIVYPEFAIPREPMGEVLDRAVRSFRSGPELSRLPALATGLYDAWVARTVPVLLLDPETGEQLAQVDVPATGPHVTAWFEGDSAVVATGDRIVWIR